MAMEQNIKRLVLRMAREAESRFRDKNGGIDKDALTAFVLDEFERTHEDALSVLEQEGARFFVWEAIRELFRNTRSVMGSGVEEDKDDPLQPTLPSLEMVKDIKLTVPVESGHDTKDLVGCMLWELDAVSRDYERRAETMLQHRKFVRALASHMRRRGFSETDTVRKLYKVA